MTVTRQYKQNSVKRESILTIPADVGMSSEEEEATLGDGGRVELGLTRADVGRDAPLVPDGSFSRAT